MLHRSGPFDEDGFIKSLKKYLPANGRQTNEVFEIEYIDDDLQKVMVANFVWLNKQWVYIDVRDK